MYSAQSVPYWKPLSDLSHLLVKDSIIHIIIVIITF